MKVAIDNTICPIANNNPVDPPNCDGCLAMDNGSIDCFDFPMLFFRFDYSDPARKDPLPYKRKVRNVIIGILTK